MLQSISSKVMCILKKAGNFESKFLREIVTAERMTGSQLNFMLSLRLYAEKISYFIFGSPIIPLMQFDENFQKKLIISQKTQIFSNTSELNEILDCHSPWDGSCVDYQLWNYYIMVVRKNQKNISFPHSTLLNLLPYIILMSMNKRKVILLFCICYNSVWKKLWYSLLYNQTHFI